MCIGKKDQLEDVQRFPLMVLHLNGCVNHCWKREEKGKCCVLGVRLVQVGSAGMFVPSAGSEGWGQHNFSESEARVHWTLLTKPVPYFEANFLLLICFRFRVCLGNISWQSWTVFTAETRPGCQINWCEWEGSENKWRAVAWAWESMSAWGRDDGSRGDNSANISREVCPNKISIK